MKQMGAALAVTKSRFSRKIGQKVDNAYAVKVSKLLGGERWRGLRCLQKYVSANFSYGIGEKPITP